MKKLANGFPRIWQDVQTKIKVLISQSTVTCLHIDTFLKIIDTVHLLIQVGHKFCDSQSDSLKQSLKDQCWTYFQNYHQQRLSELNMHLENEGWQLCPVKASFKITQLREFHSSSHPSPKKKVDHFHHDFVAPFENFLEESILEEDFLLQDDFDSEDEELNQEEVIDEEGDLKTTGPFITSTSLMLLRLFGKYLHLLQMLEPISSQVFGCLTQLMDRYLMAVFECFTKDLVSCKKQITRVS